MSYWISADGGELEGPRVRPPCESQAVPASHRHADAAATVSTSAKSEANRFVRESQYAANQVATIEA